MTRFPGLVAIVTGGGRGIGAETARRYVAEGGRVLICDIDPETAEATASELGDTAAAFAMDVADPNACAQAVDKAVDRFGGLDHLVNSAVRIRPGMLAELAAEEWRGAIDVGLTGSFLMGQAAARWMIANDRPGAMVNLSSVGGRQPYAGTGAYSTVKAAVIMLSRQMAIEWARHGIRVNCIAPGHTETPLTAYMKDPEIKRARAEATPLGRVGQPGDIVAGILFLLSEEAGYITAADLDIDGGLASSLMNHMPGRKWD